MKSTIFLLVHFSIFGDLDWEGSNGDQKKLKKKKQDKILGTITNTLFGGGLLLRTGILTYFNSGGFSITVLTLDGFMMISKLKTTIVAIVNIVFLELMTMGTWICTLATHYIDWANLISSRQEWILLGLRSRRNGSLWRLVVGSTWRWWCGVTWRPVRPEDVVRMIHLDFSGFFFPWKEIRNNAMFIITIIFTGRIMFQHGSDMFRQYFCWVAMQEPTPVRLQYHVYMAENSTGKERSLLGIVPKGVPWDLTSSCAPKESCYNML